MLTERHDALCSKPVFVLQCCLLDAINWLHGSRDFWNEPADVTRGRRKVVQLAALHMPTQFPRRSCRCVDVFMHRVRVIMSQLYGRLATCSCCVRDICKCTVSSSDCMTLNYKMWMNNGRLCKAVAAHLKRTPCDSFWPVTFFSLTFTALASYRLGR